MSRRLWFLLLALVPGMAGASAGELAPAATRKEAADKFGRLVADLGSDDFATREAARQAFDDAGPEARPALERALVSGDADVRRQARAVAERWARRREAADVLEPKRLRLAYRDVPLRFALQDFTRASGCTLVLDPALAGRLADKTITLDTGLTSFWDAFDQFCRAAGLTPMKVETSSQPVRSYYGGRGGMFVMRQMGGGGAMGHSGLPTFSSAQMTLTEGKPTPLPTFLAGALRVRALPPGTPLGAWAATKGDQEVFLALEVGSEPGIGWQGVQSLRIDKALDDKGQSLTQPQGFQVAGPQQRSYEEPMFWDGSYSPNQQSVSGGGEHVPARLRLGKKPAERLVELRGTVAVKVQTPPQTIAVIDNVLKAASQSAKATDGTQLRLLEVQREENGLLRLRIQVEVPQPENMPMWWGMRRWGGGSVDGGMSNLVLHDANDHPVRQTGAENLDDGSGGPMEYRVTFQPAPGQAEPTKLILQGRRTAVVEVPFVLRDVPLR